ncbi:MAG TPA: DUF2336 domain-containing protein [Micropepsaceae bacterium]|nr:DUF2336 domain-containing protein [Micropepsaceae bacterium]
MHTDYCGNGMASSKLDLLLALAREPSGEKRRELLREVTDAFTADESARTQENWAEFDKILASVAQDLETSVRTELARKIAANPSQFGRTARNLAFDEIAVARPVIESSRALSENDLLALIAEKSQDHMMAVTRRGDISEKVSDALVERGEDHVVESLLKNENARIAASTYERVAERAEKNSVLEAPLVRRKSIPLDLLSDLYLKVKAELRQEILSRYGNVSATDLEAAFERGRKRMMKEYGALPEDFEVSRGRIDGMRRRGELKPSLLVRLMREGKRTEFIFAFATLTGTDYRLVNRLVEREDVDGIAILSRAVDFDRALFVTVALMIVGEEHRMSHAEVFGKLYQKITVDAARAVVRFWKVRAKVDGDGAALSA